VIALYGLFFERRYLVYLAIGCGLALALPVIQERIVDIMYGNEHTLYGQLNSFAWRRKLWQDGLRWMEPTRYLLGYGAQAFPYYTPSFFAAPDITMVGAHNVYVQWFFDYGVVGFAVLVFLLYTIMANATRLRRVEPLAAFVVAVTLVAYLICAFSDNMMGYLSFNWYVWFLVGAGYAWAHISSGDASHQAESRREEEAKLYSGVHQRAQAG
jgi:O-antigen ligase